MGSKLDTRSQRLPPHHARQHEVCLCWGCRDRSSFMEAREGGLGSPGAEVKVIGMGQAGKAGCMVLRG